MARRKVCQGNLLKNLTQFCECDTLKMVFSHRFSVIGSYRSREPL